MSVCPKCNHKLRVLDIGQQCPYCGVNMRFFGFEERFVMDAKKAELSAARAHMAIKKFKRAYIGNKLAVVRLAVLLVPLLSMLAPVAEATITLPYLTEKVPLSALGLYNIFSNGTQGFIGSMTGSAYFGEMFSALQFSVFACAAAALFAVLVLLLTLLCCISVKKMSGIICCCCALGTASSAVSLIAANNFTKLAADSEMLSGRLSFGFAVIAVAFIAVFVINLLVAMRGLPLEYGEGDLERLEIAEKIRRGELKLEDLPQPIVETSQTRKIAEQILAEQSRYEENAAEEAAEEAKTT